MPKCIYTHYELFFGVVGLEFNGYIGTKLLNHCRKHIRFPLISPCINVWLILEFPLNILVA